MAIITFPRAFPAVPILTISFEPDINSDQPQTGAGEEDQVERGRALWRGKFATTPLQGEDFETMRAWLLSVETPPKKVLAWDTRCRYPLAYRKIGFAGLTRASGGTFDGTCTLASVGTDGVSLGLSGLPAGFILGAGDPLSFPWDSGRQAYHRIVSTAAAAASDGTLMVEVRPVTSAAYSSGVTVQLAAPVIKGYLIKGSVEKPRDRQRFGTFSFEVKQSVRRD